jgi:long-chain-fatty-acid--[acyl-carrier-protein] ligase
VRASTPGQLGSLRLAVTGAEKCPERTYAALAAACPQAVVLEGSGVTECSPIVAANREDDPRPGSIGQPLPSVECAVVDLETNARIPPSGTGMLLVRGPSVFAGYLGDAPSPFVEFEGKSWYRTGDLVQIDAGGVLTFRGRLKRFIKLGGEMISLPAIEAALLPHNATETDEGPVIAVEATPREEHPEVVLFTTREVDRQTVNRQIRDAQLSPLHNVTRVVRVEQIPVLGTGKTDYRALRDSLR